MATISDNSEAVGSMGNIERYSSIHQLFAAEPVVVTQSHSNEGLVYASKPLLGPLLFENEASDARDHCANERTFLSWLRLSVYMAIVSVAIALSFHLKQEPTALERRIAVPFGVVFWFLSIACLGSGVANYFKTVQNYSTRTALVQSGWKTEIVFTVVAVAIVAACVLFLVTNAEVRQ